MLVGSGARNLILLDVQVKTHKRCTHYTFIP